MVLYFLDDAEDPGGRLASLLAARHRRPQDPALGVVDGDPLVAERNDGHERLAGVARLDGFDRAFAPPLLAPASLLPRSARPDPQRQDTRAAAASACTSDSHNETSCASHLIGPPVD